MEQPGPQDARCEDVPRNLPTNAYLIKVVGATFSELPMARTDVVGVPVWACRSLSGGARPQIAGSYLPPDAPKLAQASKMVVLTHLSDDRS